MGGGGRVLAARRGRGGIPGGDGVRAKWEADVSLRVVMLHMIHEYARHNGHADLLREAIDGVSGPDRPRPLYAPTGVCTYGTVTPRTPKPRRSRIGRLSSEASTWR